MGIRRMDIQELITLYNDGLTYADMAKHFGKSHKSISGYVDRLKKKGLVKTRENPHRPHRNVVWDYTHRIQAPPRSTDWNYEPNETSKRLMELNSHDCRFPLNGGFYCGKKTGLRYDGKESSYCQHHHNMCWNKPKVKLT